jgi:hypothetical protein
VGSMSMEFPAIMVGNANRELRGFATVYMLVSGGNMNDDLFIGS